MMSKVFIDTNILIYSMDRFDRQKQKKCRLLLKSAISEFFGVISTQVMQEFYVTATKKLEADPTLVKEILHSFQQFEVVVVNPAIIHNAIDCCIINRISFWDSLIVAAAHSARCEKIWTEDLNDGQVFRGVQIENPLKKIHLNDFQ